MGRLIALCLTAGQTSDHLGAKILYPVLPDGPDITLIGDRGYDSDDYRAALRAKGITACIPPRKGRNSPASFFKIQYKQRHKIENMFGRLKDWRRIATRYDRRADIWTPRRTGFGASIEANFIVGSQVRLHRVTNACPQAYFGMILARISGGFRILNRIRLWAVVAHGKRGGGSCSLAWPW